MEIHLWPIQAPLAEVDVDNHTHYSKFPLTVGTTYIGGDPSPSIYTPGHTYGRAPGDVYDELRAIVGDSRVVAWGPDLEKIGRASCRERV